MKLTRNRLKQIIREELEQYEEGEELDSFMPSSPEEDEIKYQKLSKDLHETAEMFFGGFQLEEIVEALESIIVDIKSLDLYHSF